MNTQNCLLKLPCRAELTKEGDRLTIKLDPGDRIPHEPLSEISENICDVCRFAIAIGCNSAQITCADLEPLPFDVQQVLINDRALELLYAQLGIEYK